MPEMKKLRKKAFTIQKGNVITVPEQYRWTTEAAIGTELYGYMSADGDLVFSRDPDRAGK